MTSKISFYNIRVVFNKVRDYLSAWINLPISIFFPFRRIKIFSVDHHNHFFYFPNFCLGFFSNFPLPTQNSITFPWPRKCHFLDIFPVHYNSVHLNCTVSLVILIKQSQKSRSILLDGSRILRLFRKGKTCIIAKFHRTDLVICGHSREGKSPFYNQIGFYSHNF